MSELPSILGMHFRPSYGACQTAPLSPDFWPIYKAERDELRLAGLTLRKDGDYQWHLDYDPHWDRKQSAASLLPELETAYMPKIEEARAERAAKEAAQEAAYKAAAAAEAEAVERKRQEHEAWLESHGAEIEGTLARAQGLLDMYGDAVIGKVEIAHWMSRESSAGMIAYLRELCDKAEDRISQRNLEASEKVGGVDWPEETVIAAVEILTGLDDDHAQDANGIGWSAGHSSAGHWCAGALNNPSMRENAIKLARHLVGHYVGQLAPHLPEVVQRGAA